jgi:hypothetical protein
MSVEASTPFRSPVLWLAAALLLASIGACIVTILLALGQPVDALPGIGETLFRVPSARGAES